MDVELEARSAHTASASFTETLESYGRTTFPPFWSDPLGLRDRKTFCKALPRLLVAGAVYCFCMYGNCLVQAWMQKHMGDYYKDRLQPRPPHTEPPILWDIGFAYLPRVDISSYNWADKYAFCFGFLAFLRFTIVPGPLSMRWTLLKRIALLTGLLFGFRAFSIISTPLPNPDADCVFVGENVNDIWRTASDIFLQRAITCLDVLYSGHSVGITLSALFIMEYDARAPWFYHTLAREGLWCSPSLLVNIFCVTGCFIGCLVIIASRFHYTVDVYLGALLTIAVFKAYHALILVAPYREKHSLWARALCWFEAEAPDMIAWQRCVARRAREHEAAAEHSSCREQQLSLLREEDDKPWVVATTAFDVFDSTRHWCRNVLRPSRSTSPRLCEPLIVAHSGRDPPLTDTSENASALALSP